MALEKLLKLEVFEAYGGMYNYKYLPEYAQFLLNNHLHDYTAEQMRLANLFNLPILSQLKQRYSDEEMFQIALTTAKEYLTYIAANRGKDQIIEAMNKWLKNQLEIVGQADIGAEDITLIHYMRGQSLKKFLPVYVKDLETFQLISAEIDLLLLGAGTTSTNIFIDILRDKIAEQSKLASKLIEASPAITFLFDTVNNKQVFVSGKVHSVLGYTVDDLIQMGSNSFLQLIHPRDLEHLISHMENLLEQNSNETTQAEFRFRHKDGKYRWLRTYEVIFSRDNAGKPELILGKTFEITNEKETAIALAKREQQLLEAQSLAHIGSYEWNIREQRANNSEEVFRIFEMDGQERYEDFIRHVHSDDVQKVKDAIAQSFISGRYECEYRFVRNGKEKVRMVKR